MFSFPNPVLKPGEATDLVIRCSGMSSFHKAVQWVWRLPYGRNSDRSNYLLVPQERRGACSTKHAFLTALAEEQEVNFAHTIGIFMMSAENTPPVGPILSAYGLQAIPEAHCFIQFQRDRYDFTTFSDGASPQVDSNLTFVHEQVIRPNQIGE